MTVTVWDRQKQQEIRQKVPAGRSLWFLYNTKAGRLVFRGLVSSRFAAGLNGRYMKSRLSVRKIRRFAKVYSLGDNVYEKNLGEYRSFNDFFIRRLKSPEALVDMSPSAFISPADSQLLVYDIHDGLTVPVKGSRYTIGELLGGDAASTKYAGGKCLVFRMAPHNYHRYCYCDNATQSPVKTIKGRLHSVNPIASHNDMKIYTQNYRQYTTLRTENFGDVVHMEIGAMLIGKIKNHSAAERVVQKGEEKGFFEYGGSTVILLVEDGNVDIDEDIIANSQAGMETTVMYGEKIGTRKTLAI
jgi:phosphatidylserine decarboxylase